MSGQHCRAGAPLLFPDILCLWFLVPPPRENDGGMPSLSLPYPAAPLPQRTLFDLQAHEQQEGHSQEKANGVETLREQGGFEWALLKVF